MKKQYIYTLCCLAGLGLASCQDTFLDLKPLDSKTDVVYFQRASDFQEYANQFYGQLPGWPGAYGNFDCSSDLSAYSGYSSDVGHGGIQVGMDDGNWTGNYGNIRTINILFQKADGYANKNEIAVPLGEGYFFRAMSYFNLLKRFGGVPIVLGVLDTDSPEMTAPRNSRYEVVDQILSDLDEAIARLPRDKEIQDDQKGRIGKYAAEAFKARVLLYEATWRKYNKTTTDFEGSAGPKSDQVNAFLDESIRLNRDVIQNGGYSLFTKGGDNALYYLFQLENGEGTNGYSKKDNNEFMIYQVYDFNLKKGTVNLNETLNKIDASRTLMDMFVCRNGLPIAYKDTENPQFQGYVNPDDEFKNRDKRLAAYINTPAHDAATNSGRSGYAVRKFHNDNHSKAKDESANYPTMRLAEVYLNLAEALYERNGSITDADLNATINQLRKRAGVANLTNQLVNDNGLDMLQEIRRERAVELFMEGFRFDDLKRWGISEKSLNADRCGRVVGGQEYPTIYRGADGKATGKYKPTDYPYGETKVQTAVGNVSCIVLDSKANFNVEKRDYLWPIPQRQINLNGNLKQNPGY